MGGRPPSTAHPPARANAPDRCLLVFTKPPVPGRVKTRLIGHLSAASAAHLHQALLADLLDSLGGGRFAVRLHWAVGADEPLPPMHHPVVERAERQRGRDLGERMFQSLSDAALDHPRVAVVGSDLPGLDAARVDDAFDRLERADVVLGPTADGGYYLMALRATRIEPALFEGVEWSTARVLEQTLDRCQRLGLRREMLEPGRDIDRPADLDWLMGALRDGRVRSPRVLAWLERHHAAAPHTV